MSGITTATALTYATAAAAVAGAGAAVYGATKAGPKAPAPVTPTAAPTVNDARVSANNEAQQNQARGALANMLTPINSTSMNTANTSLKTLLGA